MQNGTIERILFATDFLESSRLALDYAVALAHHFKARIIMFHVVELSQPALEAEVATHRPSLTRKSATARLEAFAAGARRTGLEVETIVEHGVPSEVILRAVVAQRADLLVLGIHGIHRGVDHLLVGSNTEKLLLSAECPTLTVGPHVLAGIDLELHLEEILYFSDFTPEATAAAPYALMLGRSFGVPVDVCQLLPIIAEDNPRLRAELSEQYCAAMPDGVAAEEPEWCLPGYQLDRSVAIDQILQRAKDQAAGIIVLGVKTQSQLGRHLHTSFAYNLLAKATCPVLTVRGGLLHKPV